MQLKFSKFMYLEIVDSLPDKYNDLMNLVGNRELRACLPIQELNILLEPIQKASEIEYDFETSKLDSDKEEDSDQSSLNDDDSMSESDIESDGSLVEVDEDSDSNDSVENTNLTNI